MLFGCNKCFSMSLCIPYEENRQMLFYCGIFSSLTGLFWMIMGLIMKYCLPKPVGNSVNSVAYGIILVGIAVLLIGLVFMISSLLKCKIRNKTSALSSREDLTTSSMSPNNDSQNSVNPSSLP